MSQLSQHILNDASFVKRGAAYFRVHGEGILQVIKYEKDHAGKNLNIGLFSMYSELMPQWFTSAGCIPRYSIFDLVDHRALNSCSDTEFLITTALPWLESIDTHRKMLDGLFLLETNNGGNTLWNDELKIAPYLMCRDYLSAEKVISAILDNHRNARKMNKPLYYNAIEYQKYVDRRMEEDQDLFVLLDMIQKRDEQKMNAYLKDNYVRNVKLAKFCIS
jgi:hypothetical protein